LNQLKSSDAVVKEKFSSSPGYGKQNGCQRNIKVPKPGLVLIDFIHSGHSAIPIKIFLSGNVTK
jgi:hypothetical protein